MAQKWFVSRQCYWGVDEDEETTPYIVEVAAGGSDYANPNMLTPKWRRLGEGQEFFDPREAAEAAIDIRHEWEKASPDKRIAVAHGATGGFTMPFDPCTDDELVQWAEMRYEALEKCAQCDEVLGDKRYGNCALGEYDCCSEYCAEKRYCNDLVDDDVEVPS